MHENIIINNLEEAVVVLQNFLNNNDNVQKINNSASIMSNAVLSGNKIISCGNGGSMSDAMHFAEELTGRFRENRDGISAIAISDPSYITCAANDFGYENVFSRFVNAVGKKGDVLFAISTSGNSQNIINAVNAAKEKQIFSICLTGNNGGKLKDLCDLEIRIEHFGYSDRIQEMHIKIIHTLVQLIEIKVKQ
jgi:D-sedoheptulose 7-phosphate isomerase